MKGHNGHERMPLDGELRHKPRVYLAPTDEFDTPCWLALNARGGFGSYEDRYLSIRFKDGRMVQAHRLSYYRAYGAFDPLLCIHHRCFRKRCINPAHLEAVTCADNSALNHVRDRELRTVAA